MADFSASRFSIDSALELVADHWEAQTPDSALFRSASSADRVTLSAGLLDGAGSPVTIVSITSGVIDEYELTITPKNIVGMVRGRDASALILDSFVDVGFARPPVNANPDQAFTETLDGFNLAAVTPADTVGRSLASEIARKVVEAAGLTLQWEARDYEVVGTFQASGRVIDILRRLIEPWTLVEPFRVDIYLQGTTVIVRHRQLPEQPLTAPAENTLSILATRRSQIVLRKRKFKKIGTVRLRGRRKPQGLTAGVGLPGVFTSGEQTIEYVNEGFDAGRLVQRTVMQETFRTPDRILLRSEKTVYSGGSTGGGVSGFSVPVVLVPNLPAEAPLLTQPVLEAAVFTERAGAAGLVMTSREFIEHHFESSLYDESGPVNSPKPLGQEIRREVRDTESGLFRVDATEVTTYAYDDVGFLTGETTVTRKFDETSGFLELDGLVVKTVHDVGALIAEQIVETYGWDTDKKIWGLRTRQTTLGGGHRPGGPGRGGGTAGIPRGGGAAFDEETIEQTFSMDADAIPVEYANENLTLADLQFIMAQFAATPGLWEYEVQFDGVAAPWLRRGAPFKFFALLAEDGSEIPLPTLLLTEVNSTYDESSQRAQYAMRCRGFGWATL